MLVAAALVPDTALLLAGAAGRADPLADVREDAFRVVTELLDEGPGEVVVVVPARRSRGARGEPGSLDGRTGPWRPTLAAAGIPDGQVGLGGTGEALDDVPAAVAVTLLSRAGWAGPVRLVPAEAPAGTGPHGVDDALVALGRRLAGGTVRTALLLAGSFSARRGASAPLPAHPRAQEVDSALLASFEHPAWGERAAVACAEATEVAASVGGPALVLAGAAPAGTRVLRRTVTAPLGVGLPVVLWAAPGAAP